MSSPMHGVLMSAIPNSKKSLEEIINQITTLWIEGRIEYDERDGLIQYARENAQRANELPELSKRVSTLEEKFKVLSDSFEELNRNSQDVDLSEMFNALSELSENADDFPEYIKPTDATNVYNDGDKVTFNGKHYICILDDCVWDPVIYPTAWSEVVD